ncbi:hypothetical protein L209DRAFT_433403 [Thermothelomyces heterothallicus CBS 203.75]
MGHGQVRGPEAREERRGAPSFPPAAAGLSVLCARHAVKVHARFRADLHVDVDGRPLSRRSNAARTAGDPWSLPASPSPEQQPPTSQQSDHGPSGASSCYPPYPTPRLSFQTHLFLATLG